MKPVLTIILIAVSFVGIVLSPVLGPRIGMNSGVLSLISLLVLIAVAMRWRYERNRAKKKEVTK